MAVWDSANRESYAPRSHPWLAQGLFALDVHLRRRQAVFEYTEHPSCIFRLGIAHSSRSIALTDGTYVEAGRRIARLHFWNEHIPPFPENGATIAWARQMRRAIAISLHQLALYFASRPDLDDIAVICGDVPSGTKPQIGKLARIMAHYGFEVIPEPEHLSIAQRLQRFGENFLISMIVFALNAGALRPHTLNRLRLSICFSRRLLNEKFGKVGMAASDAGSI